MQEPVIEQLQRHWIYLADPVKRVVEGVDEEKHQTSIGSVDREQPKIGRGGVRKGNMVPLPTRSR